MKKKQEQNRTSWKRKGSLLIESNRRFRRNLEIFGHHEVVLEAFKENILLKTRLHNIHYVTKISNPNLKISYFHEKLTKAQEYKGDLNLMFPPQNSIKIKVPFGKPIILQYYFVFK